MALNEKQARFAQEYLVDLNATQAAIRAGYSKKTAYSSGQRLLKHVDVQALISDLKRQRERRTEITQDRVVAELAKIGFADIRKLLTDDGNLRGVGDWDDETAGAVSSVELVARPGPVGADGEREVEHVAKIRTWDKRAALEALLKHLSDGDDGDAPPLNINITSDAPVKEIRVTQSED